MNNNKIYKLCPSCQTPILELHTQQKCIEYGTYYFNDEYGDSQTDNFEEAEFYCPECNHSFNIEGWEEADDKFNNLEL